MNAQGVVDLGEPRESLINAGLGDIPAVIHLDLDGTAHIYRVHGWSYDDEGDPIFETGLRRALNFFDRVKARVTMFVIAEDLADPGKRELIEDAVRRGHEVASHSLTHRKLTTLDRNEKEREIFESRECLEQELDVKVRGFRAPGFHIDREALELIDAAGYAYDSSVFPNVRFARKLGVAKISAAPHCPLEGRALVELTLPLYTPLPFPFHPCYSMVLGMWYFRAGLRRFRRTGAPLVLLFHVADFADPFPYRDLHDWKANLYSLPHVSGKQKQLLCQHMLDFVRQRYEFVDTTSLLRNAACGTLQGKQQCSPT
jgi:peptidoglycan/xylan/chitin deacetylase (PgdA/CDA1 family)